MVKQQQAAKAAAQETAGTGGSKPWTAAEQTLLESAMRTVDKAADDRWGLIAERVPGRSKREVIARVKDLKERLKAGA
jgi:hypothetical protein